MSNPYQSPSFTPPAGNAASEVQGPAIALMVVAIIAIVLGVLSLFFDVFLLASGMVDRLEEMNDGPVSKHTTILIRAAWGVILVLASCFVFYGALKMKNLQSYDTAKAAAVVAMIPCLGPCCILGIPFGIWAFLTLQKPHIRDAFR